MKETYSIEEFCLAFQISKPTLYKLLSSGNAPKTYTIGKRRFISGEAAHEWIKNNEKDFVAEEIAPNLKRKQSAQMKKKIQNAEV